MGTVYLLDLSMSPTKESAITNTPSDSEALPDNVYGSSNPFL